MNSSSLSLNQNSIFKYNQHAVNIYEKLQKLYEEKHLFDTVLIAGNDCIKIPSHKIVLSALSEYFWEIFLGDPTNLKTNEVELKDIEASTLKTILDYMYSGSIELNLDNIETLLRSAKFLKMDDLVDTCYAFLVNNINISNCLHWLCLAKEFNLSELQEESWILIYTHFEQVRRQTEFLLLNETELKDLLFIRNFYLEVEEQVFLGIVAWLEFDKVNRQHLIFELLSMVRFQCLTPSFIIANTKSIIKTVENYNLIFRWLDYHLLPELPTIEQQNLIKTESRTIEQQNLIKTDLIKEVNLNEEVPFIVLNDQKEAEIKTFNKTLKTWSIHKKSHRLLISKSNYSMIVIGKKLFLVGGTTVDGTVTNSVECLDLRTFKLRNLPPMNFARYQSQLADLNGYLCVFGGFEATEENANLIYSVEIFKCSTSKWSNFQPLRRPSRRSRILGHNGILYILNFVEGTLEIYDVYSKQWTLNIILMDDRITDLRMVAVDNIIYTISVGGDGGVRRGGFLYHTETIIKSWSLSTNTYCRIAKSKLKHSLITNATVIGNKILFREEDGDINEYNIETKELGCFNGPTHNCCFLPLK